MICRSIALGILAVSSTGCNMLRQDEPPKENNYKLPAREMFDEGKERPLNKISKEGYMAGTHHPLWYRVRA